MDLYLTRERIHVAKNVLKTTIIQEETMEMIVPDALPDILRVVCADATALVRGKETDAGRVSVSGIAAAAVIYSPEGQSGVKKLIIDIPFNISAAEGEITASSKVTAAVHVVSAEASVINPRKLAVKVTVFADIACYNDEELSVCTDVEVGEESGIEMLRENRLVCAAVDVKEKAFVISDELNLPNSGQEIGEILKTKVYITAEEAKIVGNKLIFRGNTAVSLLYNTAESGEISSADLTSEFSQIMELDSLSDESDFEIILMLTGAYFEIGGVENTENKVLSIELHVVAQCVASEKLSIPYIGDVYSTKYRLTQSTEELELVRKENAGRQSSVFRGTLETAGNVSRVIAVNVSTGAVENETENASMSFKVPLYVTGIYISDDGRLLSASGRFESAAAADIHSGCKYEVRAECGREVYGAATAGGIELRIPVDFQITELEIINMQQISGIAYDEDEALNTSKMPSLMISKTVGGDTIWKLAKKHHSTKQLILSANGIENEEDIAAGQMLIIPKKR